MQNRGILITLRAAAIVIIVTGLNDVIASAVPRYEPLYLYLAAVALVALTDGILLGIVAAILSVAFYALLFMPRAEALSAALLTPAAAAVGVAVAGAVIRGFVRSRHRKPAPSFPVRQPLLETSAVAHVTDNAEVLAAIDELRNELRTAVTDLGASRGREGQLVERTRDHAAELDVMQLRIRQFENDRDWALKVAEEARVRADRERGLRADAERALAEAREESATMAGRVAELELSLHEGERLKRDITMFRARIAELEADAAAATPVSEVEELRRALRESQTLQRETAAELAEERTTRAKLRARAAELETAVAASTPASGVEELRKALRESQTLQCQAAAALAEERATRAKLEEEKGEFVGRLAELELSLHEGERLKRDITTFRARIAELEADVAAATPPSEVEELRRALSQSQARITELETALAAATPATEVEELRRALSEAQALQHEAAAALAEERAAREKLEAEAGDYDKKLQTIVTHLASDHEADLGQVLGEKEEARAEARALSMKLSALQRKYDDEAVKLRDAETLLAETRSAAQTEIDRLRALLANNEAPRSPRPRVMIVHPDADLRAAASATLERAGYDVVTAADGLEALRVAIAKQPDIVIAETSMPKMDGRELCQMLKSKEKTAHIRVVLLMRASDEEPRGDLPPDEILRKPVPVETLKATLANLLSSSRA